MNAPALSKTEWLTATQTAKKLGLGTHRLHTRAESLGIRMRLLPGVRAKRFHRGDVEHVVAELEKQEAARVAAARRPSESGRNRKAMQRP